MTRMRIAGLEHVKTAEDLAALPLMWRVGLASCAMRREPSMSVEARAAVLAAAIWPEQRY